VAGVPYDFEIHSRFSKFGQNIRYSFNSGMVAKEAVKVEVYYAEEVTPEANMIGELPVMFLVEGVPRFFHQGSGDHRVIVSRDGYNIYIYFTGTGISIRLLIRPLSASGHITSLIPGSMSTYLCMPETNNAITNAVGLTGTYDERFVDTAGAKMSVGNKDDFCVDTWCVKDAAETLFTFADNTPYDFDFYNGCGAARRAMRELTGEEETFVWSEDKAEVWEICGLVNNSTECLTDGYALGPEGARMAAEAIWLDEELRLNNKLTASDAGCCSSDFKTCLEEVDCEYFNNEKSCGLCVSDNTYTWLPAGSWPLDDDNDESDQQGCKARNGSCSAETDCCPDMTCENSVCVAQPVAERRLSEPKEFVRKDVGETRNIVPLGSEL
jgi:hypothetical protein